MLKKIILMVFTTFGFTSSDVKLLDLPNESKNFGASVKDYYKIDNKGNYTYIYQNEDGTKQRQDGLYGEKRGYYTFKAPLPDGRTFTVCYYTKNGYHAKTTIIEVDDIESYCDMIIEQSGSIKLQYQTKLVNNMNSKYKSEQNEKVEAQFTRNESGIKPLHSEDTLTVQTALKAQTMQKSDTESQADTKNFRKVLPGSLQIQKKLQKTSTTEVPSVSSSTSSKFIISIEEPIANTTIINATFPFSDIVNVRSDDEDLNKELNLNFSTDTVFLNNKIERQNEANFDITSFCNQTAEKNNSKDDCNMKAPSEQKKTKVEKLLAEISKYGIRKNDKNKNEILPPSKLFLPPYIDDEDIDTLLFVNSIPLANHENTTEIVSKAMIPLVNTTVTSKTLAVTSMLRTTTKASIVTVNGKLLKKSKTVRKRVRTSTKIPTTEASTTSSPTRQTSRKPAARVKITGDPESSTENIVSQNRNMNLSKIKNLDNKPKDDGVKKPSLDLIPPFGQPSFDLLPPLGSLIDDSKDRSPIIVSRSIPSNSKLATECNHKILRTDVTGKIDYISSQNVEEAEAIRNAINVYGCKSIKKNVDLNKLNKPFLKSAELISKNCRLDIIEMDKNGEISYLDPESVPEMDALKKLNAVFGCFKN